MNKLRTQVELLEQEKAIIDDSTFVDREQLDSMKLIIGTFTALDDSALQSLALYKTKSLEFREKTRKESTRLTQLEEEINGLDVKLKKLLDNSAKKKYVLFTRCKQITSYFKVHFHIAL